MARNLVENGQFQYGFYREAFKKINILDAKNISKIPNIRFWKKFRLKEWLAFQFGNKNYFGLVAFYNPKITALIQFVLFDKQKNKFYHYQKNIHPREMHNIQNISEGKAYYKDNNCLMEAKSHLEKNEFLFHSELNDFRELPSLKADFTANFTNFIPMAVCLPFAQNRAMYSLKSPAKLQGSIFIGKEQIEFNPEDSFLILDDHKGFYPYHTRYDWITGAGNLPNGNFMAFNLTKNQALDPEIYNENGLWLNNKLYRLPLVKFKQTGNIMETWHIYSKDKQIDLFFHPKINKPIYKNYFIAGSEYDGPMGEISGKIKIKRQILHLNNLFFGMGEKKHVWI